MRQKYTSGRAEKMKKIDLHTHSTASDGTDSPSALVRRAKDAGLAAIALTDHDTNAGLAEARIAARLHDIILVPGCEISTRTQAASMHILGLWIPSDNAALNNFFQYLNEVRERRNRQIIAKLQSCGIKITLAEVMAEAAGTTGRPHFANVLVKKGVVEDISEAFSAYLGHTGKAYVPKEPVDPASACRILSDAGATVILAHPLLDHPDISWLDRKIHELSKSGLQGLEVWHTVPNPENEILLLEMARAHGMLVSGGTDYHGANKPEISLGTGYGNLDVPFAVYENLCIARKKRGLPC